MVTNGYRILSRNWSSRFKLLVLAIDIKCCLASEQIWPQLTRSVAFWHVASLALAQLARAALAAVARLGADRARARLEGFSARRRALRPRRPLRHDAVDALRFARSLYRLSNARRLDACDARGGADSCRNESAASHMALLLIKRYPYYTGCSRKNFTFFRQMFEQLAPHPARSSVCTHPWS